MVFWAPDRKSSVWYCEMAAKSEKVGLWKEKVEREREKKREKRKKDRRREKFCLVKLTYLSHYVIILAVNAL